MSITINIFGSSRHFFYQCCALSKVLVVILLVLVQSACTQNKSTGDEFEDVIPKNLRLNTAVSTGIPGFVLSAKSTFSMVDEVETKMSPGLTLEQDNIDFIKSQVQSEVLQQKQATLSSRDSADYILSVHIVYGNSFSAQMLAAYYGIAPSLTDNPKYQKGTLIVLIKNQAGQAFWKGAVQIYGDSSLAPDIAQKRTAATVASLVRQIPSS